MSNTSEEELYYDIENNPIHIKYNKYDETIDLNGILKKNNPEEGKRLNYMISYIFMMGIIIISIPFKFVANIRHALMPFMYKYDV